MLNRLAVFTLETDDRLQIPSDKVRRFIRPKSAVFTREKNYSSETVIHWIMHVKQIIRLNLKMKRSSFSIDNPPNFILLFSVSFDGF